MRARGKTAESGRFALLVVAVVTVIGAWAAVLVMIGRDGSNGDRDASVDRGARAASTGTALKTSDDSAGVEILDPGPLRAQGDTAVVATDREVVVWSGDGAAYEPETARWRTLAPAPLPSGPEPPVGVWTGAEVVIFRDRSAAAWDPGTDAWRVLPGARGPVSAAVWTGDEIVTFPGPAALDPATGNWRDLPPPPAGIESLGGQASVIRWTGGEVLVVGGIAAAYDPAANAWRELPPPRIGTQALAGDWNGRELVVANYDMSAAAFDPEESRWRALPSVPARFYEWYPFVASVDDRTAVFMAQSLAILDSNDSWLPLPYGRVPSAVAQPAAIPNVAADPVTIGNTLYLFGFNYDTDANVFAAIEVDALSRSAETVQVGAFSLTLPDGTHLEHAMFDRYEAVEGLPPAETVSAELAGTAGDCRVASTYVGTFGEIALDLTANRERTPIAVTPLDGSEPWDGIAGIEPTRGLVRLDDSDLLEISCAEDGQARELARFVSAPR
jgi:hypothetical protein